MIHDKTATSLTPAEALTTIAILAAGADGKIRRKELERLRMMVHEHPLLERVEDPDGFLEELSGFAGAQTQAAVIERCRGSLSPRLRETAYAWAAQMIQEDGAQHQGEHAFLERLRASFSIAGPLAAKIRAVTAIRRRAS